MVIGLIISAIGLFLTAAALFYAGKQFKASQRVSAGDFLLRVDEMLFTQHNDVHTFLRPGGKWAGGVIAPSSPEEWNMVERYMGMFERVKVLMDDGLLDVDVDVDADERFYGYRIRNIIANQEIVRVKQLHSEVEWTNLSHRERKIHLWKHFIELWHELEREAGLTTR
jgi:hypothetical protein